MLTSSRKFFIFLGIAAAVTQTAGGRISYGSQGEPDTRYNHALAIQYLQGLGASSNFTGDIRTSNAQDLPEQEDLCMAALSETMMNDCKRILGASRMNNVVMPEWNWRNNNYKAKLASCMAGDVTPAYDAGNDNDFWKCADDAFEAQLSPKYYPVVMKAANCLNAKNFRSCLFKDAAKTWPQFGPISLDQLEHGKMSNAYVQFMRMQALDLDSEITDALNRRVSSQAYRNALLADLRAGDPKGLFPSNVSDRYRKTGYDASIVGAAAPAQAPARPLDTTGFFSLH